MMRTATLSGFRNAPVSKALLIGTAGASILVSIAGVRSRFVLDNLQENLISLQWWRLFTHKFFFSNPGELLLGLILIYYFRLFERQMGSSKFGAFVVLSTFISFLLELSYLVLFGRINSPYISGPYGFIFACVVLFYYYVPVSSSFPFFGVTMTDKTLTYLLVIQLMMSNMPLSGVAGLCGLASGLAYCSNTLRLSSFQLPSLLTRFCKRFLLPFLQSSPSTTRNNRARRLQPTPFGGRGNGAGAAAMYGGVGDGRGGATTDQLIPNMNDLWAQAVARNIAASAPPHLQGGAAAGGSSTNNSGLYDEGEPSPEDVEQLMSMGFDRNRVIRALRSSGGDLQMATSLLLE
ncbi:Rhomboid-like protein 20 [Balamuthia mandrillaris]